MGVLWERDQWAARCFSRQVARTLKTWPRISDIVNLNSYFQFKKQCKLQNIAIIFNKFCEILLCVISTFLVGNPVRLQGISCGWQQSHQFCHTSLSHSAEFFAYLFFSSPRLVFPADLTQKNTVMISLLKFMVLNHSNCLVGRMKSRTTRRNLHYFEPTPSKFNFVQGSASKWDPFI